MGVNISRVIWLFLLMSLFEGYKIIVKGNLTIFPSNELIDGIIIHLSYKFIKYRVHAQGIHLNVDFENTHTVKDLIEKYKNMSNLHCNLSKENEEKDIIEGDILRTNNCVIFINITYKDNLKHIYDFMEYLHLNTSATALIFICDNFLYENEIYNPHEDLNLTIIHPSILTYLIPYDLISHYEKTNYDKYTFELYWGVQKKTDLVHIIYHLDFGKYFNYTFFIYMKHFLLELKNYLTYEIQFSIHKNFTIDPRFCFIRDSSYCISKPDYVNSNVVREVVEQQVRSLCIYELTAVENEIAKQLDQENDILSKAEYYEQVRNFPNTAAGDDYNSEHIIKKNNILLNKKRKNKIQKKTFSEKYIHYINALFDFGFEKKFCSNGSNDLTKKCSDKILSLLHVPVKEVDKCFLKNFHTYMKNMIKSKFYVYSITINDKTYKIKLNKDISIKLICSAFKIMPKRCVDYLMEEPNLPDPAMRKHSHEELLSFYFLLIVILAHITGTFLNYL
ncbi:hypothetical protein MKS88_005834 [Plasmodium brasilianum]|uniref:Uncharacterized protein n=1 Tax=Plasmodium brasilianum TaxID=5824 RepID=A0ACB9Y2K7_PLABR|nr:hypothetical protein MKS88_005834 [Plasmodium brasilianum]